MKYFIIGLILLISSTAFSADTGKFVEIGKNPASSVYLVKGSIESDQSLYAVWAKFEYTKIGKANLVSRFGAKAGAAQYSMVKYLYNCDNTKSKVLSSALYDSNGIVIMSEGIGDAYDIIPGSIGDSIREVVCYYYWNPDKKQSQTF